MIELSYQEDLYRQSSEYLPSIQSNIQVAYYPQDLYRGISFSEGKQRLSSSQKQPIQKSMPLTEYGQVFLQSQGLLEHHDIHSEGLVIQIYPSLQRPSLQLFLEFLRRQMQRRVFQYR
jgi:hypothetical protein